ILMKLVKKAARKALAVSTSPKALTPTKRARRVLRLNQKKIKPKAVGIPNSATSPHLRSAGGPIPRADGLPTQCCCATREPPTFVKRHACTGSVHSIRCLLD